MAATPARPLRIVFFGPPNAGKTGLLRAFLKLAGSPTDYPPPATGPGRRPDVVPYAAPVEPSVPDAGFVLLDVDGRAASDLIANPDRLRGTRGRLMSAVAGEVRSADAIVLTLDAADTGGLLDLFRDFARFLDGLEETRAFGREVGGLPVFLTLTKCDRLWLPGDDPAEWEARVQTRLRNVRREFEEYLAERTEYAAAPVAFGSIEVHVAATALHFPADPRFESLGDGPYGVGELSEDCTAAARAFRDRAERSRRRLRWTLAGSSALLGTLLAGLLAVVAFGPGGDEDRLARRVLAYQEREGPAEVRFADRNFARNRAALEAIRDDSGFDRLPSEFQEFVANRLREFEAYQDYRDKFRPPQLGPAEVRSRAELDALESALAGGLAPPPEYAAAWADSPAVRLWEKWKQDAALLRQAEAALNEWYYGLIRRGTALTLGPALDAGWRRDVAALLRDAETPPFRPDAEIPGSERLPVRRGAPLTYAPAFDFDRVDQVRYDWKETRDRLTDLRDMADALGTAAGPGTPPAILDLPEPTGDPAASRPLAAERLKQLAEVYHVTAETAAKWAMSRFPDPVRGELQRRLQRAFDAGVRHARGLIRDKLGASATGFVETHAAWESVAAWLDADPQLQSWGRLLRLLARWAAPEFPAEDPVSELAAFLRKERFDADLRSVELTVPDDLRAQRVVPAGNLVLTNTQAGQPPREYAFRPVGTPRREGPTAVYRFVPDGHDGRVTFRPGDGVTAALRVRSGGQEFRLEWANGRSAVYQFGRLTREPSIRRADPAAPAEPATGVRLAAVPETGLPAVPVLLPDVTAGR